MIGLQIFLTENPTPEEVERAATLQLPPPEPREITIETVFRLDKVSAGRVYGGRIELVVDGRDIILVYDPLLWNKIKRYLESV